MYGTYLRLDITVHDWLKRRRPRRRDAKLRHSATASPRPGRIATARHRFYRQNARRIDARRAQHASFRDNLALSDAIALPLRPIPKPGHRAGLSHF